MYQYRKQIQKREEPKKNIISVLRPYILRGEIKKVKRFYEENKITYYIFFADKKSCEKACGELMYLGFQVYTDIDKYIMYDKPSFLYTAKVVVSPPPKKRRRLTRPGNAPEPKNTK